MACPPGMSLDDCAAMYRQLAHENAAKTLVKFSQDEQKGGAKCTSSICYRPGAGMIKSHVFEKGVCKFCGCEQVVGDGRRRRTHKRKGSRKAHRKMSRRNWRK